MSAHEIPLKVYDHVVRVTDDKERYKQWGYDPGDAFGECSYSPGGIVNIFINGGLEKPMHHMLGTVAHECMHAVNFVMRGIGQLPDRDNDEAECHLMGHLVEEITEWMYGPDN